MVVFVRPWDIHRTCFALSLPPRFARSFFQKTSPCPSSPRLPTIMVAAREQLDVRVQCGLYSMFARGSMSSQRGSGCFWRRGRIAVRGVGCPRVEGLSLMCEFIANRRFPPVHSMALLPQTHTQLIEQIKQSSNVDPLVQGLAAFLLGICLSSTTTLSACLSRGSCCSPLHKTSCWSGPVHEQVGPLEGVQGVQQGEFDDAEPPGKWMGRGCRSCTLIMRLWICSRRTLVGSGKGGRERLGVGVADGVVAVSGLLTSLQCDFIPHRDDIQIHHQRWHPAKIQVGGPWWSENSSNRGG